MQMCIPLKASVYMILTDDRYMENFWVSQVERFPVLARIVAVVEAFATLCLCEVIVSSLFPIQI